MRLWKDKLFWIGMVFMFGLGIVIPISQYFDAKQYFFEHHFDETMMAFIFFIGFIAAVFCSNFIGTEYSDGTIRNKLIVGRRRTEIYLSSVMTTAAAAVCMMAAYFLSYSVLGLILLLPPKMGIGKLLLMILIGITSMIALISVFHMVSMLVTKRSAAIIICVVLFLVLWMIAFSVYNRLSAPEFIASYVIMSDSGEPVMQDMLNPKYLQPNERVWYQLVQDFLPTGQHVALTNPELMVHPVQMLVYSAVICILTTVLGIVFFQKKNLK